MAQYLERQIERCLSKYGALTLNRASMHWVVMQTEKILLKADFPFRKKKGVCPFGIGKR